MPLGTSLCYTHPEVTISYNGLDESSPIRKLLDFMSDKWVLGIIYSLATDRRRTGELQRMLPGISKKKMIQNLRNLEAYRLAHHKVFPVAPPHVEYSLTKDGEKYIPLLVMLYEWSGQYNDIVKSISDMRNLAKSPPTTPARKSGCMVCHDPIKT